MNISSEDKYTVLKQHQAVIYPNLMFHSTNDGSDTPILPKKYVWYPNMQIESPVKTKNHVTDSPGPKTVSSYFRYK